MEIQLSLLSPADLPRAQALLAASCRFDAAAEVAEEKLFGAAPEDVPENGVSPSDRSSPRTDAVGASPRRTESIGASLGSDLVGLAATSQRWIRLLAVHPGARGRGLGSALLAEAERRIAARGQTVARTLDQPGNYLAPGIDAENRDAVDWLERRGYRRLRENTNLLIDVIGNPRVGPARAAELAERASAAGYDIRRAHASDRALLSAQVARGFSRAWAFEVERALDQEPPAVHLALRRTDDELAAFAAHDGNNRGLGWFGPAGTWAAHRRRGLGEALLVACLVDVAAAGQATCQVAWTGPRGFYERAAGLAGQRRFVVLGKDLVQLEVAA